MGLFGHQDQQALARALRRVEAAMAPARKPPGDSGGETRPRTKVVVRNLPPGLTSSAFLVAMERAGFVGKEKVRWWDYVQGKAKLSLVVPSVAYVDFADELVLKEFASVFGGRAFEVATTSTDGDENSEKSKTENLDENSEATATMEQKPEQPLSRTNAAACVSRHAVVEYAPNQKTPRLNSKKRKDPLEGTIAKDAEFLKFVEELNAGPKSGPSAETLMDRRELAKQNAARRNGGVEPVKQSALLSYLALQSNAWKVRDTERSRNKSKNKNDKKNRIDKKNKSGKKVDARRDGGKHVIPKPSSGVNNSGTREGGKKTPFTARPKAHRVKTDESVSSGKDSTKNSSSRKSKTGNDSSGGGKIIPEPSKPTPRVVVIDSKGTHGSMHEKKNDKGKKGRNDQKGKDKEKPKPPPKILTRPKGN